MQKSSTGDQSTHNMTQEGVGSIATRKSVRITGISVGIMQPDERAISINLKLDRAQFSKLPFIDPKAIPEQRKWSLSLNLQEGSEVTVELKRKRRFGIMEKDLAQITVAYDKVRSLLDSAAQDQPTIEYQIHTGPEICLSLESGSVTPQARMDAAVQKSEEISSVLAHLGKWRGPLEALIQTSAVISELHPAAKAVFSIFDIVYRKLDEQDTCTEQVSDLAGRMANICRCICDVEQFARLPQLKAAMEVAQRLMERIENFITSWAAKRTVEFFLNDSTKQELDQLTKDYNIFQQQFDRGIAIDSASNINLLLKLQQEEKDDKLLEQLKSPGIEKMQRASECLPGTRETILSDVDRHLDDLEGPNTLWIRGHPGAGKSAIASTIVSRLLTRRRLGSYFVFDRAKADILTTSALWRHVGYSLAENCPSSRRSIIEQLKAKEVYLDTSNSEDLFKQLVEQALKDVTDIPPGRMPVIIIDALDECGGLEGPRSAGRRDLLKALRRWPQLSARIKLVITSRPEEDIERALSAISISIDLLSGTAVTLETSDDIRTFFTHHFHEIAERFTGAGLSQDWPGQGVIDKLTARAAGLFIWATTAIDIVDGGDPPTRLQTIIDHALELGNLYSLILNTYLPSQPLELEWFRILVSAMILAKRPLSSTECVELLGITRTMLKTILDGLRSVLDESGDTLRFAHQSFVDFLLNPHDCPEKFRITKVEEAQDPTHVRLHRYPVETRLHQYLIDACLRTMTKETSGLRFNICDIETSSLFNVDVPDIEKKVKDQDYIPSHLSYSCFFWADHLSSVPFSEDLMERVKQLVKDKFLFWLEVMSLLNEMNRVDPTLKAALEWSKSTNDSDLLNFLKDARAFVRAFIKPITESAPHIYISALPFAPTRSLVANHFRDEYTRTIIVTTGKPTHWASTLFVTEHHQKVDAVAFSPDGSSIATYGDNGILICGAESGNIVSGPFESSAYDQNVTFCSGGHKVTSALDDGTVRIWDVETGIESLCLHASESGVACMASSNDGPTIAICSKDGIITIWDTESGKRIGDPLKSQTELFMAAVMFSPDGQSLVLGSSAGPGYVEIWNIHNGDHQEFSLEEEDLYVIALSPDGQFVAGGLNDGTVCIWSIEAKTPSINLEHGGLNYVLSLAYSADGKYLASASQKAVKVWDVSTGQNVFAAESAVDPCVALSANPIKLVLGSGNGTVRMWDLGDVAVSSMLGLGDTSRSPNQGETGSSFQGEGNNSLSIFPKQANRVVFSPCGKKLASISHDGIRVWNVNTGEPLLTQPINKKDVSDVVFSPDGEWIVSLSDDGSVCFWDVKGEPGRSSPAFGHDDYLCGQLAFLPNGKSLVYCGYNQVCIWDPATMEHPIQHMLHDAPTQALMLSPDGTKVIGRNKEGEIQEWGTELEPLEPIPVRLEGLEPSSEDLADVTFSPSGKLAYLDFRVTLTVWDVKTGRNVDITSLKRCPVDCVTVSPDDRYICARLIDDREGKFLIYDVNNGHICGTWYDYTPPGSRVHGIRFSPDGKRVASYSYDGMIKIWDISDFTKSHEGRSPQQPGDSPVDDHCKLENGWVKASNGELLFWVPESNRTGLWWPRNTAVIAENLTELDYTKFEYGDSWEKCRDKQRQQGSV